MNYNKEELIKLINSYQEKLNQLIRKENNDKLDELFKSLKENDIVIKYNCLGEYYYLIIKEIYNENHIDCLRIDDFSIQLVGLCYLDFKDAKKVKELPTSIVERFKTFGIRL